MRAVVVGKTFRFGHRRAGRYIPDAGVLARTAASVSYRSKTQSTTASASRARAFENWYPKEISPPPTGSSAAAATKFVERSKLGAGRGHGLGFPTANVLPPDKLLPKDGVYSAIARYDGRDRAALVSIGTNPQFGGTAGPSKRGYAISIRRSTAGNWRFATFVICANRSFLPTLTNWSPKCDRISQAVAFPSYG